jgi:hypothetical protein
MSIIETKVCDIKSLNIKNPDFQRYLEPERVNIIMEDVKTRGYILGCITLCKFSGSNEYLCIDGQHRYQALLNLKDKEYQVAVQIITIETEDEAKNLFFKINQAKPVSLPETYLLLDKPKQVVNKLKAMFPSIIKNYSSRRRPFVNENDLLLITSKSTYTVDETISIILKLSDTILNTKSNSLRKKGITISKIDTWKEELKQKGGFYLGLYPNEYTPEMLDGCNTIYNNIDEEKKKIEHLRKLVWERCTKSKLCDSNCPACNCDIDIFSYEISHNIPKSKGGSDEIDNLRVLCGSCNRRSGNRFTVDEWISFLKT